MTSDGEIIKINFVDIEKSWNFVGAATVQNASTNAH
jgi:hypothetical protein